MKIHRSLRGSSLSWVSRLTKDSQPQTLICANEGAFPVHISWGVLATFLVGTRLRIWAAVSKAYPQNEIGSEARLIMERTISNKVRLRLSSTPFNCGVLGGVDCETIPHSLRWSRDSELRYSPPRSDFRIFIFLPSWFSASCLNSLNFSKVYDLCLIK